MSDLMLEFENFNFYYYGVQVLHSINLPIEENKITAVIGPSGSGKSTLLRSINRIFELYPQQQAEGKILYRGQNVFDEKNINQLRLNIGMVFQKPTVFPMTIFDNVAFALRLHEKLSHTALKQRVTEALQQAALWSEVKDKLYQAGSHLSGGQQQRLCMARTLAVRPKVLLLDEPTSALDPVATQKVEELITALKDKYTIVMVTHHLRQAKRLSDTTVFMKDGRIVETAASDVLFSHPKHPDTQSYISDF